MTNRLVIYLISFKQVKWLRVLYLDFQTFAREQEYLISSENTFDYIEGFVIKNRTGLLNDWRKTFRPRDEIQASKFKSDQKTLFCIELAKYYKHEEINHIADQVGGNHLQSECLMRQ